MQTVRELVTRLGGPSAVAGALGLTHKGVFQWMYRGRVPYHHERALLRLCSSYGISADAVHNLVTANRKRGTDLCGSVVIATKPAKISCKPASAP